LRLSNAAPDVHLGRADSLHADVRRFGLCRLVPRAALAGRPSRIFGDECAGGGSRRT
jgi:hypothetical protein